MIFVKIFRRTRLLRSSLSRSAGEASTVEPLLFGEGDPRRLISSCSCGGCTFLGPNKNALRTKQRSHHLIQSLICHGKPCESIMTSLYVESSTRPANAQPGSSALQRPRPWQCRWIQEGLPSSAAKKSGDSMIRVIMIMSPWV